MSLIFGTGLLHLPINGGDTPAAFVPARQLLIGANGIEYLVTSYAQEAL
jgi:hypothetical protein